MTLTWFDEAAAGSKQHGGKKIVIKKISSDIVFNAYESRSLTALQQKKGVGNFLEILKDSYNDFFCGSIAWKGSE